MDEVRLQNVWGRKIDLNPKGRGEHGKRQKSLLFGFEGRLGKRRQQKLEIAKKKASFFEGLHHCFCRHVDLARGTFSRCRVTQGRRYHTKWWGYIPTTFEEVLHTCNVKSLIFPPLYPPLLKKVVGTRGCIRYTCIATPPTPPPMCD